MACNNGPILRLEERQMKARRRIVGMLVVGLILVALAPTTVAIEALHYRLVGEVNGKWSVQMNLVVDGAQVSGEYWYDAYGIPLVLDGVNRGGSLIVKERTADGKVSGEWAFDFNPFVTEWKGTWTSADRTRRYPFSLRLLADMVQTQEVRRGFIRVWLERPLFAEAKSNRSMAVVQEIVDSQLWSSVDEDFTFFPEMYPDYCRAGMYWEHVNYVTIRYASNSIISMMHETYGYAGGAHGMTWYTPINLRLSSSGASRFGLDDVFLKGSGWEKKVSELIIADLKKQKAGWITRGEVTKVGVDLLDRFTVSPAGIDFYFGPYEMGCYAEGSYVSFLPWSALKGFVDTSGPAGFLK